MFLFPFLLLLWFQSPVYYVSPLGSDSNLGTESQPFRTIQRAANVVNPGDTVLVSDGVYNENVRLNRGGTSSAPITFKSVNKYGAKVSGSNNARPNGFTYGSGAHFINIEGFEIYGMGNGSGSGSGIELYNGGQGSKIVGNHIHDIGRLCTETSNGQVGIYVQQPNVLIEKNLIHDIGRYLNGENGCVTSYQASRDHGVYVNGGNPGASGLTARNNIFYNTNRGWAMQLYPGSLSNLTIINNTFAFENPFQPGHIILGSSGSNNQIRNNIFYDPKTVAIHFYSGSQTNMSVTNNITYGGTIGSKSGVTFSSNQNNTDPLLVAPLVFDFHLQSNSPAINMGVLGVVDDFDGNSRDVPDIGAYEFGGSSPTPTPTPDPTPSPTPTPEATPTPSPLPSCVDRQVIGNPPSCICEGRVKGKRCWL